MSTITDTKTFKVVKWFLITFAVFSMIFTALTIAGENNFAQLTLADDGEQRLDQYVVDLSEVDDKEELKEEIDILVDKTIISEKKAELEQQEKDLNAREASLE